MLLLRGPGLDPAGMEGSLVSPLGHAGRLRAEKASPRCRHSCRGVPRPSPVLLGLPSPTQPGQRCPLGIPHSPSGCPLPGVAQPPRHP